MLDRIKVSLAMLIVAVVILQSCGDKAGVTAHVLKEGYIECFPEGLTYHKERKLSAEQVKDFGNNNIPKPVTAEISGVAYYHNMLVMVNDKPIPGTTPLMTIPYDKPFIHQRIKHIGNENIQKARKFEDISLSPNLEHMFLITGFDRIDNDTYKKDSYNLLFYRELKDSLIGYDEIAYPEQGHRGGEISSLPLRKKIKAALKSKIYPNGPTYFKVEALAALPNQWLLIGIREMGKSYEDFDYTITILGAKYSFVDGDFILRGAGLKEMYSFNPRNVPNIKNPIGLSSMEYDNFNKRLLLLTSYEHGEEDTDVGAYLWSLPMYNFERRLAPELVMTSGSSANSNNNIPLHFAHKAEGITILDKNTVFIIHDDDRRIGRDSITDPINQFTRKYNQAGYSIVKFD